MKKADSCTGKQTFIIQILLPDLRIQKHLILVISKCIKNRNTFTQTDQKSCRRLKCFFFSGYDHISRNKHSIRLLPKNLLIQILMVIAISHTMKICQKGKSYFLSTFQFSGMNLIGSGSECLHVTPSCFYLPNPQFGNVQVWQLRQSPPSP